MKNEMRSEIASSSFFSFWLSYIVFLSSAWKTVGMTICHVFLSSFRYCFRTLAVILVSYLCDVHGFVSAVIVSRVKLLYTSDLPRLKPPLALMPPGFFFPARLFAVPVPFNPTCTYTESLDEG